jgi:hypothetical protein
MDLTVHSTLRSCLAKIGRSGAWGLNLNLHHLPTRARRLHIVRLTDRRSFRPVSPLPWCP